MISRTFDSAFLNTIANDPEVRPFLGPGVGPLDLGPLVENPAHVTLVTEHGGWLLQALTPGVYELHTMFESAGRGEAYFAAAREALRYVFGQTDCLEIWTKCPDDNPAARMAAVKSGFRERAHRDGVWDNGASGISYQALTIDDWAKRDDMIEEEGAGVLCMIEAVQPSEKPLDGDAVLNRMVGALVLMMRGAQTSKGVAVFNRSATFYGFPTIVALRHDLADIGACLVLVKPEGVGVLPTS